MLVGHGLESQEAEQNRALPAAAQKPEMQSESAVHVSPNVVGIGSVPSSQGASWASANARRSQSFCESKL